MTLTFRSPADLGRALAAPPYGISTLRRLPSWSSREVPDTVGDPAIDELLVAYRAAVSRAKEIEGAGRAAREEHDATCRRYAVAWTDWIYHPHGKPEPQPDGIEELARRVETLRDEAEVAIRDVARLWGEVVASVGGAAGVADRVHSKLELARDEYLAAVTALAAAHSTFAHAAAVARWVDEPDEATFAWNANPPRVLRPGERDKNGVPLVRIIDGLRALAEGDS